MRTEFISLFADINAIELENLTRETKETVAKDVQVQHTKPAFTTANLWNIHNMRKERTSRRYI